ncbi:MAG TPA: GNAT family N-acetyltransferase [Ensifer sp.]|nr:GNAT family N-acetyltransferase [Ensifer sp.]
MNGALHLRQIREADKDVLCSIRQDALMLDALMSYPDKKPIGRDAAEAWVLARQTDASRIVRIIADDQDHAIGYVQITGQHGRGHFAWFAIALAREAQGKGLGAEAMKLLTAFACDELQLRKLLCEVRADNSRAIRLYTRLGFSTVGTLARHYLDLSGHWRDVNIMERMLP